MAEKMDKPALFVASSVEGLGVAYNIQSNLEHDAEVTVWSQGVFLPSTPTLTSLISALPGFSFAVFAFTPDDLLTLRGVTHIAVRDNVLYELGLCTGHLAPERCFIVTPRGVEGLRWPSDLLGLTPLEFDSNRSDANLLAALGPACQAIREAMRRLGVPKARTSPSAAPVLEAADHSVALLSWVKAHTNKLGELILYSDLDRELRLAPGTTKAHIKEFAAEYRYHVQREGPNTIVFRYVAEPPRERYSVL